MRGGSVTSSPHKAIKSSSTLGSATKIMKNKHTKEKNFQAELEKWNVSSFIMSKCDEGCVLPRFYLPVRNEFVSNSVKTWIFPLAPFALLYYIISDIVRIIWRDLFEFSDLLRTYRKNK